MHLAKALTESIRHAGSALEPHDRVSINAYAMKELTSLKPESIGAEKRSRRSYLIFSFSGSTLIANITIPQARVHRLRIGFLSRTNLLVS
jgi:hypothetical protein